jgi:hypothetical protein
MVNKVLSEIDLYEPMRIWLNKYLTDKYKDCVIHSVDAHSRRLELVLSEYGITEHLAVGIDIQIDVLGIIQSTQGDRLVFIEAKDKNLTLKDLGQLWVYCKLINPAEAFLISSKGFGSLAKIFQVFKRLDLLSYDDGKQFKTMKIAIWDKGTGSPDLNTMIPRN